MEHERAEGAEQQRLERLRQDLYRPAAPPDAVDRYVAQRAATRPAEATVQAPRVVRRRRARRPPSTVLVALGVAAVVAVTAVVATGGHGTRIAARPSASPGTPDGQALTPYGAIVPVPTPVAVAIDGQAAAGQSFRGRGDSRFPLGLDGAPTTGGRLLLTLSAQAAAPMTVHVIGVDPQRTPAQSPLTSFTTLLRPGTPATSTVPYPAEPPMLVEITTGTDVEWTVTAVFLPAAAADLR